uniref:Golgi anti-apoptotic protein n=1 Tax=Cacopsylla melanoneura TaxID=428564 RepID=A0A8D8W7A4_9HEMI
MPTTDKKRLEEEEYLSAEDIRSYLRWRVYFFLLIQIILGTFVIWSIFNFETLFTILQNNLDVLYIAELTAFLGLFILSMFEEVRCDSECGSPVNLVTLAIFSLALAIHACGTIYYYTSEQIWFAALVTGLAFLGLSQIAFHSSNDFYVAGGNAVMFTYIFRLVTHIFSDNSTLVFAFKILNLLITCVDIISDTQALKFVQCSDYVLSCANLYFNIFHMYSCTLDLMPMSNQDSPTFITMIKQLVSLDFTGI